MAVNIFNGKDEEGFEGRWVTTDSGQKVFIRNGETIEQAFSRRILKDLDKKDKQIKEVSDQAKKLNTISKDPEDYLDDFVVKNSDIGIGGGMGKFREYMRAKGFSEEVVEETRRMTSAHSGYNYEKADAEIVKELESGSEIGKCFEARIEWEEAMYKAWRDKHKNEEDAWRYGIFNGEKKVYRKGNRKTGVEPWTSDEDGADMGYGNIGIDHKSTVEQLLREGYHILGGIGNHLGSPGEDEVTFVKYRKKAK